MIHKEIIALKKNLLRSSLYPKSFEDSDNKTYSFKSIIECSPELVLSVRNAKHVLKFMADKHEISLSEHIEFLDSYSNLPRLDYMIISENSEIVGGVNIVLTRERLEIGKYIGNPNYLRKGIAKLSILSLINFINEFLPEDSEIFARTMANNYVNIALNEKIGFKVCSITDKNGFLLMKKVK